ncbi:dephospho-CoA kinase [Halobacillus sp. A1]|uniref:dephospho-CoA kinase n=1 Tax=Halobacillus sp. A1 TaxID=2880262 RepID=UPI0020A668B0|nr:dephospho-CoA kinase [Halobacillus sp. A1]MCP3030543.1 dephospho-CoA kinase [Halobacillus sp. A1]
MGLVIGLTGSIATGKSTISKMIKSFQIPVVDADIISREVVEIGKPAYLKIVEVFGEGVLNEDGTLNRKSLGNIVFKDKDKRGQLNGIVHPEVRKEMVRQRDEYLNNGERAVVLDIPLLFESKLNSYADRTLVVYVDEDTQLKRLMDRDGSSEEEANYRINSQISIKEKAHLADAVIDNSGTLESSRTQLQEVLREWGVLNEPDLT